MNLFFNKQQCLRIIWRLILFIVLTFFINIPFQSLLQSVLAEELTRGYISASIFLTSVIASLYVQARFVEKNVIRKVRAPY